MHKGSRGATGADPFPYGDDLWAIQSFWYPALCPRFWVCNDGSPVPYPFQEIGVSIPNLLGPQFTPAVRNQCSYAAGTPMTGTGAILSFLNLSVGGPEKVDYQLAMWVGGVLVSVATADLFAPIYDHRIFAWSTISSIRPAPFQSPGVLRPAKWSEVP